MRHPVLVAESFLRANNGEEFPEREFGFEAQGRLVDFAKAAGARFLIVDIERFMSDPEAALKTVCEAADFPFVDSMLKWEANTTRPDWPRSIRLFPDFYTSVVSSSGFYKKAPKPLGNLYDGFPSWLQGYVDRALPVYTRLLDEDGCI